MDFYRYLLSLRYYNITCVFVAPIHREFETLCRKRPWVMCDSHHPDFRR